MPFECWIEFSQRLRATGIVLSERCCRALFTLCEASRSSFAEMNATVQRLAASNAVAGTTP